ncbi:hypothetical protein Q4485_07205 [Granulosicoccaceae sp. 1_MG-2023]|nr:hypothetical protein [Granulosicoccaceae sp. 1_MG-2023]
MPTTKRSTGNDELREEFNALRDDVTAFMKTLRDYERNQARNPKDTVSDELHEYLEQARRRFEDAKSAGEERLADVGDKVRAQPAASLAIAFAVGLVAAKLLGRD